MGSEGVARCLPPRYNVMVGIGSVWRAEAAASIAAACLVTAAAAADRVPASSVTRPCWHEIGGFVVVCDPLQLARDSARKTGPPLPATLRVSVAGYRTACILGLCQTVGDHLIPGQRIVFKGRPGRETYVVLFPAIHSADASIVVRPRDLMMAGRSMVWTVFWREGMHLPRIRELYPHHRLVPFHVLQRRSG